MEPVKLTAADLDQVREIEGFPMGADEDILALSNAPYYTACPNPFLGSFLAEHGTPYEEETDDYHREPFAADVSEGKHDPMYMAHSYHTKVPFRAIMRYILNYTKPGDVVLDGFCGTGMTGVAAQMCGAEDFPLRVELQRDIPTAQWGRRYAVLSDLSPEAAFLSYNFNVKFSASEFAKAARQILHECRKECGWMYRTAHAPGGTGDIDYTVWSNVYICPNCGGEINLWKISVLPGNKLISKPQCPACLAVIDKSKCDHAQDVLFDSRLNTTVTMACQVPVKVFYTCNGKRYSKDAEESDLQLAAQLSSLEIPYWYPADRMREGGESRRNDKLGMTHTHHFYTRRSLYVLAKCFDLIQKTEEVRLRHILMFWFSSIYSRSHKLNRYMPNHNRHVGPLSGTLYMPYFQTEINILGLLEEKLKAIEAVRGMNSNTIVTTQSTTDLRNVPDRYIDYIFTDPPFGDNLSYSELNNIWESWLRVQTQNRTEAVVNKSQGKELPDYQALMTRCFQEYYRVLKPNRWITVEFHNSKNAVWNAIQEAIQRVGFIIADVRTLDKQKGTTKQLSSTSTVQQDLVISAYKPRDGFQREIAQNAGNEATAWAFVRQHLGNVPVVVDSGRDGRLDIVAERQGFLLWDRMVAYHIMRGLSVPIDAADFYKGLDERFLKRDGMYFLPDQVNEYDLARSAHEIEDVQLALFVSNERTAISWLYRQLDKHSGTGPQTYAELQPQFMQELKAVDRREKMPELSVILEENFLKDETGRWYIPDLTQSGDIAKLREKNLLKEFQEYRASKGRLKAFRSEAIRAGFAKLWKEKDYQAIVAMAERLPEETIQEDSNLLMYYDISQSRI